MQLKKLNIVAIGGGHGLGRVLSTLSFMGPKLTGIVTTTDNGGSTGRLRKRSSTIAWGDLRNCLTQLVDENSIGTQLFNFRFNGEDELGGHNLGNLILYGLEKVQSSPVESIELVRRILRVKTQVLPMSETPTDLMAFYPEGRCRLGEMSVDEMPIMPKDLMLAPLVKSIQPCIEAINNADLIILGPGSFLTSVVPPLLVRDIAKAVNERKGHCVFIDNNKIEIGSNVLIGPGVHFYTPSHPIKHSERIQPNGQYVTNALPIIVGNNVWIGGNSSICQGVTIGNNSTIGAGSLVLDDIPEGVLAYGNPCKVIKKL